MARKRQAKSRPVPRGRPSFLRRWALPLFLGAVFAVKLIVMLQLQDHPLLQPDGGLDSAEYLRLAREVLGGHVLLGPGLYYMSPLYVYFLAAILAVSDSLVFVRVTQMVLGTAAVACIFVSARAWFGDRAAWIAAVLGALTGVFTFYEIVLFQASLDPFLTSAALACLAAAFRPGSDLRPGTSVRLKAEATAPLPAGPAFRREIGFRRKVLVAGILFGLQILNRPNVTIAVAGMGATLVLIRHWRVAALLAAGVLIALAPVVARNAIVSRQFALVSSQGGLNFYIGNNAQAGGQYAAVPGVRANIAGQAEDTRKVAEAAAGRPLTDAQVSAHFTRLALTWIREHPRAAAALFARKLALTFNARHQWLDFSYPYYAYDTGSLLRFLFVGPWLLVPLGLAGIAIAARDSGWTFLAWASFVPFYAIAVATFFVAERYRLPVFVPLCVTGGACVHYLLDTFRKPAFRAGLSISSRVFAGSVLLAATALTAWPLDVPDGRFEERLRLSKALMNRGDYGGAAGELERAYALRPADTVTEFNLGMALLSSGRAQEGLAHVRHAVDAGVPVDGARYALASAMLTTGDRDGAVELLRTYYPADTDSADSCFQVGVLALNAGAPLVAERYLQRALQLRPGWREAAEMLARLR